VSSFQYLGANVRRLRLEQRTSQAALASRLVPPRCQTAVSDVELGKLPPAEPQVRALVAALANALEVPEQILLRRPPRVRTSTRSSADATS
jgi:transcriptional regulator with XRE-family HTH domain